MNYGWPKTIISSDTLSPSALAMVIEGLGYRDAPANPDPLLGQLLTLQHLTIREFVILMERASILGVKIEY